MSHPETMPRANRVPVPPGGNQGYSTAFSDRAEGVSSLRAGRWAGHSDHAVQCRRPFGFAPDVSPEPER